MTEAQQAALRILEQSICDSGPSSRTPVNHVLAASIDKLQLLRLSDTTGGPWGRGEGTGGLLDSASPGFLQFVLEFSWSPEHTSETPRFAEDSLKKSNSAAEIRGFPT